ncbi:hypothetical protein MMC14_006616 [Varicellaria rhodocarpa]|nr:hypothetical protein [Varicellaria rhodocarpa]
MIEKNPSESFTSSLLSIHKDLHASATQHPFLVEAGKGSLPASALCKWLVQDKYYQLAYVNFIGSLLAKLDLSFMRDSFAAEQISFYEKTADKYKLPLKEAPPNRTTEEYVQLFAAASAKEAPLLKGLLILWATEHCYHHAWTFASSEAKKAKDKSKNSADGVTAALHKEFIPNWTSEPFGDFVKHLASVKDAWATKSDAGGNSVYEDLWLRVLELEAEFWPEV